MRRDGGGPGSEWDESGNQTLPDPDLTLVRLSS